MQISTWVSLQAEAHQRSPLRSTSWTPSSERPAAAVSLEKDADAARRSPDEWVPKEKDDYLRGQPQEGGRLGQRLQGRPGRVGESLHLQSDARLAVYKPPSR